MFSEVIKAEIMLYNGRNIDEIQKFIDKVITCHKKTKCIRYGEGTQSRGLIPLGSYVMKMENGMIRAVQFLPVGPSDIRSSNRVKAEIIRYTGYNLSDVQEFTNNCVLAYNDGTIKVKTSGGIVFVGVGIYILRTENGHVVILSNGV